MLKALRLLPFVCLPSFALAQVGIGIGVGDDQSTLYVPFKLNDMVVIEAGLSYQQADSKMGIANNDSDQYEVSLGLLFNRDLAEKVTLYYGLRAGYLESETTSTLEPPTFTATPVASFDITPPGFIDPGFYDGPIFVPAPTKTTMDYSGYSITPLLGIGYQLTEALSLSGELQWRYEDIDADYTVYYGSTASSSASGDGSSHDLKTQLVLRYFF